MTPLNRRRSMMAISTVAALAAVAACGSSSKTASSSTATTGAAKGTLVVGSANFPESELLADMYVDVLKADGYTVTPKLDIGNREVYYQALTSGEIDIVPEYEGTLTEFINGKVNGADAAAAKPLATTDPNATLAALTTIAAGQGIVPSGISPAQDENSFAVTKDFATQHNLTKLSDLTSLNGTLVLGGPPECAQRPFCEPGLMSTYGLTFKSFTSLDAGGPLTIKALTGGDIQLGLVFSSDGAITANNLVVLQDDKEPADLRQHRRRHREEQGHARGDRRHQQGQLGADDHDAAVAQQGDRRRQGRPVRRGDDVPQVRGRAEVGVRPEAFRG